MRIVIVQFSFERMGIQNKVKDIGVNACFLCISITTFSCVVYMNQGRTLQMNIHTLAQLQEFYRCLVVLLIVDHTNLLSYLLAAYLEVYEQSQSPMPKSSVDYIIGVRGKILEHFVQIC